MVWNKTCSIAEWLCVFPFSKHTKYECFSFCKTLHDIRKQNTSISRLSSWNIRLRKNRQDVPMKSGGILPLLNLPVGNPPIKSLPYGGKLHLTTVIRLLLLPGSTIESPKTSTAGIVSFLGSFTRASVVHKIIKAERKKTIIAEDDNTSIVRNTTGLGKFCCVSPRYKKRYGKSGHFCIPCSRPRPRI